MSTPASTRTVSTKASPSADLGSVPICPEFSTDDSLKLMFLTNVQVWSVSFYESLHSRKDVSTLIPKPWPDQSEEMNFTFKLAIKMLDRDHGDLAGRLARKAFLLVEEMLILEGPALMWNMLEIMHYMVTVGHFQLYELLLAHLAALVGDQMSKNHPLSAMLQALHTLTVKSLDLIFTSSNSSLTPPSSHQSLDKSEVTTIMRSRALSGTLLSMIERAWTLNAEILFNRFDYRLFQLYSRLHWDSCSMKPPTAIIGAAKRWLDHTSLQQISDALAETNQKEKFIQITPFRKDKMLQRLFTAPMNTSPPRSFEILRRNSIAALQNHVSSNITKNTIFVSDTTLLLRVLAGLMVAKILKEWPTNDDLPEMEAGMASKVSRMQAGNIACAVRTSMDLTLNSKGLQASLDTVEQIQSIVALREYANSETDPRTIREICLLEDALLAAGEHQKALEVKQTAHRRLEMYLLDVPAHSIELAAA